MNETLDQLRFQNARLEDSLKKASDEINKVKQKLGFGYRFLFFSLRSNIILIYIMWVKGNDIIRKLQGEYKNSRSKLKLKNVVTLQQEKLLDERAVLIEAQQKEISSLKESATKKSEEIESLRAKSDELLKKLDEGKAIIEDNNHVIEWLHKQLNDEALHRPMTSALGSGGGVTGTIDFGKYAIDNDIKVSANYSFYFFI